MVGMPCQGVVVYLVGKGELPKRSEQSSDGTGLDYQEEKVYFVLELHVSLSVSSHPSFPLARLVNVIFCEGTMCRCLWKHEFHTFRKHFL